jgi:alpha-glucan,water dikinase
LNFSILKAIATKALGKTRVHLATNDVEPLILHWALAKKAGEWEVQLYIYVANSVSERNSQYTVMTRCFLIVQAPPSSIAPSGSTLLDKACETSFVESELDGLQYQVRTI